MLIFTSIAIIAGVGLAFTPNWWSFLIVWVILQSSNHLAYIAMSVYIVEIVGPSKRRWAALGSILFGVGYVLISVIAYGIPNWRTFTWSLALLSTFCIPIIWLIPISPKWLHSKGRTEESIEILKRFAEKTKRDFPGEIVQILSEDESETNIETTKSVPLLKVMKNSYFRIVALVMGYTFVATTILYYGIAYNAAGLPGNLYLNNAISGFVEIAACIATALSMAYLGRKAITCGSIIFASIVCVIIGILLHYDNGTSGIQSAYQWLGFLGKFLISGTFAVIYIWAPEIYPTEARTTGLGLGSMAARFGGVAAPFVISLQDKRPWLPYTIFGVFTFTAGLAALWLPETFKQPIHQTLPEAEMFFRNQKKINKNNSRLSVL